MMCYDNFSRANREPHGRRIQRKAISFIATEMEMFEAFGGDEDACVLQSIIEECHERKCPDVNVRTLRRWWYVYIKWGEIPFYARIRKARQKHLSN